VILDTNALSAVADNVPAVVKVFLNADTVELPVIVLGEYRLESRSHFDVTIMNSG
jgi:predicted nucleic acid-binding protein